MYDGLGRNTSIPAIDSPNNAGVISVGYRVNDQVASITQNGETTTYSFDGLGRRVTETTGSSVVTKHYTGTSDNPAWSTNTAGVTDIYVSSLGTGLNSTVTLDNGEKTLSLDVNDLRGNTVTRINVDTASTDSWVSFDEYGNRDAASTGKLVTYDAYGQYERATTSQGLILMGARLYNPVTNQFTSPDPITGGNETTYTYPNDPINKNDFTGLKETSILTPEDTELYKAVSRWFSLVGNLYKQNMGRVSLNLALKLAKVWLAGRKFSLVSKGKNGELTFKSEASNGLKSSQIRVSMSGDGQIKMNLEYGRDEANRAKNKSYWNLHYSIPTSSPLSGMQLFEMRLGGGGGIRDFKK